MVEVLALYFALNRDVSTVFGLVFLSSFSKIQNDNDKVVTYSKGGLESGG